MTPAIIIELPPRDATSQHAPALLDSCNVGAQGRAKCVLGHDAAGDMNIAVAIVRWSDVAHATARIEIGVRIGGTQSWQSRDLFFSRTDPEVERWRATGFAIATVVGGILERADDDTAAKGGPSASAEASVEASKPAGGSVVPSATPAPGPSGPAPTGQNTGDRAPPEGAQPRSWLDGAFVLGIGEAGARVAPGGELRISRRLDGRRWFVAGAARCDVQLVSAIQILRPGVAAGVGLVALEPLDGVRLSLRVEPRLDLIDVTGRDVATGRSGQSTHWSFGLRQAAETSWTWSEHLGVVADADVTEWAWATQVDEHGTPVALLPALEFAAQAGIRLWLE